MKPQIIISFANGLLLLSLMGCAETIPYRPASETHYQEMLATWKNKDINALIYTWGPPTSTFTMPNGNKMFTWANIKIGPTVTTGTGLATRSGSLAFGRSEAVSITPTWDCYATAISDSSGTIISWQTKGNNCVLEYSDNELHQKIKDLEKLCSTLEVGTHVHISVFEGAREQNGYEYEKQYDGYFHNYIDSIHEIYITKTKNPGILNASDGIPLHFIESINLEDGSRQPPPQGAF